jgi:protein-S-isoprenylcysteine O-methyltransferase Ste14
MSSDETTQAQQTHLNKYIEARSLVGKGRSVITVLLVICVVGLVVFQLAFKTDPLFDTLFPILRAAVIAYTVFGGICYCLMLWVLKIHRQRLLSAGYSEAFLDELRRCPARDLSKYK